MFLCIGGKHNFFIIIGKPFSVWSRPKTRLPSSVLPLDILSWGSPLQPPSTDQTPALRSIQSLSRLPAEGHPSPWHEYSTPDPSSVGGTRESNLNAEIHWYSKILGPAIILVWLPFVFILCADNIVNDQGDKIVRRSNTLKSAHHWPRQGSGTRVSGVSQ